MRYNHIIKMQTVQREEICDPADRRGVSGAKIFDGEDLCKNP